MDKCDKRLYTHTHAYRNEHTDFSFVGVFDWERQLSEIQQPYLGGIIFLVSFLYKQNHLELLPLAMRFLCI